jgi:hypothetical protein
MQATEEHLAVHNKRASAVVTAAADIETAAASAEALCRASLQRAHVALAAAHKHAQATLGCGSAGVGAVAGDGADMRAHGMEETVLQEKRREVEEAHAKVAALARQCRVVYVPHALQAATALSNAHMVCIQ